MRDPEIRAALHQRLARRYREADDVRVIDEMGVLAGACRIDVAVINGHLEGFEIKSERDDLKRLARQADIYGLVFDRLTVVCAERHLENAEASIPRWWGIEVAEPRAGSVRIVRRRPARANPGLDLGAVVQLLWREETLAALEECGRAVGLRSRPRRELWSALREALPARELRALVRDRLRRRQNWPAAV